MPTPALKSFATRAHVSIETAETKWDEAKREVDQGLKTKDPKQYWAKVMWLTQKKLGLKEERMTFKEYAELEVSYADVPAESEASGYGTCPECGGPGISTERRMDGNSFCAAGHSFPNPFTARAPAEEPQPEVVDPMIELSAQLSCFVSSLFGARDQAHAFHLSTNSFSQHKALEELYELLLDHADKWAEVGQGITGFPFGLCTPTAPRLSQADPLTFVRDLVNDLATCHGPCFSGNAVLTNMMQDLQAAVLRIKYKLEQLH